MSDAMTNCGRWSETVGVRLPETESRPKILEKIFLISVLQLMVTLVVCIMCAKNIWEDWKSRNLLLGQK